MCHGIALPDSEQHFVGTLTRLADEGKSAEYPVLQKALTFLLEKHRRIAVDVGAHVGLWSRWLVKRFDFVHAFEPVPEYADIFEMNVPGNRWLHRFALGEAEGTVGIRQYPDNTGQAHISGEGTLPMRTLDSFELKAVDFLKVDVEGYELQVLKGARETLLRCKPLLVIEQRGCDAINFGRPRDEAMVWMRDLGMVELGREHFDYVMGWA